MVTDDGEVQGTVDLDTAMDKLEDVITHEVLDPNISFLCRSGHFTQFIGKMFSLKIDSLLPTL